MNRLKKWSAVIYFLAFLAISLGSQGLHLITDYYWFREIDFTSVFNKILATKMILGFSSSILLALVLYANSWIAKIASRKPFVVIGPEVTVTSPLPMPQVAELKPILRMLLVLFILGSSFFVGNWSAGQWEEVRKFMAGVPFGSQDPLFGRDIGFYVFKVPFYEFLFRFSLTSVICSAVVSAVIYILNARIYFTQRGVEIAEDTKSHFAILGGLLCLLLCFYFQLKMFDLLTLERSLAPGAGYADVNAYLPGLKILRFLALLSAVSLFLSPWFINQIDIRI